MGAAPNERNLVRKHTLADREVPRPFRLPGSALPPFLAVVVSPRGRREHPPAARGGLLWRQGWLGD